MSRHQWVPRAAALVAMVNVSAHALLVAFGSAPPAFVWPMLAASVACSSCIPAAWGGRAELRPWGTLAVVNGLMLLSHVPLEHELASPRELDVMHTGPTGVLMLTSSCLSIAEVLLATVVLWTLLRRELARAS